MGTARQPGVSDLPCESLRLASGLRVRLLPLPHLQSATVSCFFRVGSRYENPRTNGLSHFLEHMLYRGTEHHPEAHALSLAIERLGGTLDAATHVDFTSYDLTLPSESIVDGTRMMAEVLRRPLLTELQTEKQIIREEILEELNENGEQIDIDNVSRQLLFPDHPLGFSIAGPIENLDGFGTEDLKAHHAAHYTARNAVLCVAGAIRTWGGRRSRPVTFRWHARWGIADRAAPSGRRRSRTVSLCPRDWESNRGGGCRFIRRGYAGQTRRCFSWLDRILDDGLSTRVHRRICEERGLAYDAFAGNDTFEECGVFDFGASVEHQKVVPLVEATMASLQSSKMLRPQTTRSKKRSAAICGTYEPCATTRKIRRTLWGLAHSLVCRRRYRPSLSKYGLYARRTFETLQENTSTLKAPS